MAVDDLRLTRWDLMATAGVPVTIEFASATPLGSLSIWTGGTVDDGDDLADATEHPAVMSADGLTATVVLPVPTGPSVPLRLAVNGTVKTVGDLHPRTNGAAPSPAGTITLTPGTYSFDLTVLGTATATLIDGGTATTTYGGA